MFHPHTKNYLVYLTSDVLENNAITHGFSTRKGGVSPAPWDSLNLDDRRGDDLANVQENFRRLCTALDTDVQRAVLSRQVHRAALAVASIAKVDAAGRLAVAGYMQGVFDQFVDTLVFGGRDGHDRNAEQFLQLVDHDRAAIGADFVHHI